MKCLLGPAATIAVLGAAIFLLMEPVALAIGDWLVVRDEPRPADVIHVVAGEDGRTDYAIQLYQQGYGRQLFFTGGWCVFHDFYHGQHGRELALQQGVPPEAIATDDSRVTGTFSEAIRLKRFIDQSQVPIRSVIVVSDAYHMRRARWTYQKVLGDHIRVQMAPVPFDASPYKRRWWNDTASRAYVKNEYLKTLYYYARYQLSWGPVKEWLASLDVD
jgi:uncharacterized SAM-binding protein YcdF (DUF218 family)